MWTIMQRDEGGMTGGYPRWLSRDGRPTGNYGAYGPNEAKQFDTLDMLWASTEWEWAERVNQFDPNSYTIQQWELKAVPLTEGEMLERIEKIKKLVREMEVGREHWEEVK